MAAYYRIHNSYPDYERYDTAAGVSNAVFTGRFQMANAQNELTLLFQDNPVQSFSWTEDFTSKNWQIHVYEKYV